MATAAEKKQELAKQGQQQAELVINNSFMDGLVSTMQEKVSNGLVLPKDYNISNAMMTAYLTLKNTVDKDKKPVLQSCNKESIANAVLEMATAGLDVSKAQGYFIPYGGKLSFQKSYFGWQTLARRYGAVKFSAMCIYDGDTFDYDVEDGEIINVKHKQNFGNIDKDKIVGAYAVVTFDDGTKKAEVMTIAEIRQAWKQNKSNGGNGDTHKNFTGKMAKKTVLSSICKTIANTYGNTAIKEQIDMAEEIGEVDMVAEDVAYNIQQNANSEDFIVDEPEVTETVEEPKAAEQPQKAEGEAAEDDNLPDFMK